MKILALHSDSLEYEAVKKAIEEPEVLKKKKEKIGQSLVVFISVEEKDEKSAENTARKLAEHVRDIASQLKEKSVVLYPYVHLSSSPSNPKTALEVLKAAEAELKKEFKVHRSPFGWYKSFNIRVKGHPLAELSREFYAEEQQKEDETESLKKERKLTSYWYILTQDGKLQDVGEFNYKGHERLKKFAFYEKDKQRVTKEEPAHVRLMRKLEFVDYEPASDGGNLRYYPKGRLIKSLIEEYVTRATVEYGGIEVETPVMYDMGHPTLSKYLARFPARQYQIDSDKRKFFLRFAACFGQFLMTHDAVLSYRNLPFRIYELTRYSFRREQSGELTGLRRLRAFTMPDVHAMVADIKQAIEEYKVRFELCLSVTENVGIPADRIEMALRTTKQFFEENKPFLMGLVKKFGKPVLLELWDERIFYFILKYDLNFVDTLDKASALSTDQIDIENAERYDISFTDQDGKKKHPVILHCSPSGAIERVMYALLEKAAFDQREGKVPQLPLWLSPTQVRVVPVADDCLDHAQKITHQLLKHDIRADLDDRALHVGKKIRQAELEWCSTVVVIGKKEKESNKLPVRVRGEKDLTDMTLQQLVDYVKKGTNGMPFKPLALPNQLSKRPIFVG